MKMNKNQNNNEFIEFYEQEEIECIEHHIEAYFGAFEHIMHELVSPDIHVDIAVVEPTPERNYYVLVTIGMGAHIMNVPKEFSTYGLQRAELMITLPPDWDIESSVEESYWPIRWLKILARLPVEENGWLGWGHTIPSGEPFASNTELSVILLELPAPYKEECQVCQLPNGDIVNFYQLIPLYEEECDYKIRHGVQALEDLYKDSERVLQVDRESFITASKPEAQIPPESPETIDLQNSDEEEDDYLSLFGDKNQDESHDDFDIEPVLLDEDSDSFLQKKPTANGDDDDYGTYDYSFKVDESTPYSPPISSFTYDYAEDTEDRKDSGPALAPSESDFDVSSEYTPKAKSFGRKDRANKEERQEKQKPPDKKSTEKEKVESGPKDEDFGFDLTGFNAFPDPDVLDETPSRLPTLDDTISIIEMLNTLNEKAAGNDTDLNYGSSNNVDTFLETVDEPGPEAYISYNKTIFEDETSDPPEDNLESSISDFFENNWDEPDGCIATSAVTLDGQKVGYMYREPPIYDWDSGWRFTSGTETEEYIADPKNSGVYHLEEVADVDPEIIALLNQPYGTSFYRDESGSFVLDT
jgi:hypothetical protein